MMTLPPYGMFAPRPRPVPRVSDWHTLVTWDEIYPRAAVTKADLIAQVHRIGVNRGLRLITAIDNIALRDGASRPDTQLALATEFTKTSPLVRPGLLGEVRKGRIAFAPESLVILAGYIVQHGLEEEPDESLVMTAFMNALLMINQLYGEEQLAIRAAAQAARPNGDPLESFLPMELRNAALDDEPFDHLVARLHAFVTWARQQPKGKRPYVDIDAAFLEMYGRTYEDVAAAGLIVRHYFRMIDSIPQLKNLDPILNIEFLVAPLLDKQPLRDFVAARATSIAELRPILAARDRMTAAALLPLQKRPFVDLGNGNYALPNMLFLSASIGIGLFHSLAEYFGAKGKRERFNHFFAQFLQQHTEETIRRAVAKRGAPVYPEFRYPNTKPRIDSSDVFLIEGRRAIFFDVCTKRLNTENSLNAADLESMERDIDGMILSQAKQLDGRIADFRAGLYDIEGLTIADIDEIIPVAVTHQSIHGWAATRRYVDRRLREEKLLQIGPRLEIVSVAELETLVQALNGDLSFADLFERRRNHAEEIARGRSLKNFLLLNDGWDGKDRSENAGFRKWFDTVGAAKLAEWGFRDR